MTPHSVTARIPQNCQSAEYRARAFRETRCCVAARAVRTRIRSGATTLAGLPLGGAQFGAARARIPFHLRLIGEHGFASDHLEALVLAELVLDDAILERVKADGNDASRAAQAMH